MTQIPFFVACMHVFLCPFTKVEESFNIQAAHDILFHGSNLTQYDHHEFPGVVPRTFVGALATAALAAPAAATFRNLGIDKFWIQYVVRLMLAMCILGTWVRLRTTLKAQFGNIFTWFYTVVTITQFHFMFYLSRPLPNMMAFPFVLMAFEGWISGKHKKFIYCAGASIIIFRSELAILFGLFLIMDLYFKKYDIASFLKMVIPAGCGILLITVVVDSYFWGYMVWPESKVFLFNTFLNKSSQWGTSPFLWYFYSALPRGLGPSLILVPFGVYFDKRMVTYIAPATLYVLLYSFLPHKELRFIIYVFPLYNMAAAAACTYVYLRRNKRVIYEFIFWGVLLVIIGNVCLTVSLLTVAMKNYPGGEAVMKFHRLLREEPRVHVHVGNLAAQTGFTRFLQLNDNWQYSKNESLTPDQLQIYTHLIVEAKSKYSPNLKPFAQTHVILDYVTMFAQVAITTRTFPPIKIKTRPALFILEKKRSRGRSRLPGDSIPLTSPKITSDELSAEDKSMHDEKIEPGSAEIVNDDMIQKASSAEETILEPITFEEIDDDEPNNQMLNTPKEDIKTVKSTAEELKNDWKQERKQKAIDKIKSITRKEVVASAKEKLREILKRHKQNVQPKTDKNVEAGRSDIGGTVEKQQAAAGHVDEHGEIHKILANGSIEVIVEEVIVRLIDKKIFDDKSKPEDLTNEDRGVIHQVVEQVLVEKVAQARQRPPEDR